MRELLIKVLFRLLNVEYHTRNLVIFDDLRKVKPIEASEIINQLDFKYTKALSTVLSTPHFIEWLYLQVIVKQREHLMSLDKEKRTHQRATIIFILWLIDQIQTADKRMKLYKK